MTNEEKLAYKEELKKYCRQNIEQRIAAAKLAIDNAQEAANNEEKSSAGDKYETSRAMSHLEKDMYARQLASSVKELSALHDVQTDRLYSTAAAGAVVICDGKKYFIAAGIGKQSFEGAMLYFLSPFAPLAKALAGKTAGTNVNFNGNELLISEIF